MKEILQHTGIVLLVLFIFSLYLLVFTPYIILGSDSSNEVEPAIVVLSDKIQSSENIVQEQVIYDHSILTDYEMSLVYEKNRPLTHALIYYQPLGKSDNSWLESEGMNLVEQGYLLVSVKEVTGLNYSKQAVFERFNAVQEIVSTKMSEHSNSDFSINWLSEGIGGKIVLDYFDKQQELSAHIYLVNPYFSFEDYQENVTGFGAGLFANKYEQGYSCMESTEDAIQLNNSSSLSIYGTKDSDISKKIEDGMLPHYIKEAPKMTMKILETEYLSSMEILKNN